MERKSEPPVGNGAASRDEPIAIVGLGGVFPGARTLQEFWQIVERGTDVSRPVPAGRWILEPQQILQPTAAPDRVYTDRGCFVEGFQLDPTGLDLPQALLAALDPAIHLLLEAGRSAFASARTQATDRRRVGVVLGNIALPTEGASRLCEDVLAGEARKSEGNPRSVIRSAAVDPGQSVADATACATSDFGLRTSDLALRRYVSGLPAGVLAQALGLGGGSCTLDAACASSLYALKLACDELRANRADAMLAGGLSRPDSLYTQMGFCQLGALAQAGRCAPFDAAGSGLIVGEGAGVFVLKRLSDALLAGDEIHALIRGIGLSNDLDGNLLSPRSEGQLRALRQAYQQAGWSPEQVDLIECHATGTPVGDAVEFESLLKLWQDGSWQPGQCVLGAVKANIGHLLTAAGSASLIKVLLALKHNALPATANFQQPAEKIPLNGSPFRILQTSQPWPRRHPGTPRRAAINGFGFGGINAHVLIEEWLGEPAVPRPAQQQKPTGKTQTLPVPSPTVPIAIVGLAAQVGSWPTLRTFQERVLGGGPDVPASPGGHGMAGHFLEDLAIPVYRYRIPPKELAELLPQQALMLEAAHAALADARTAQTDPTRTGVFIGLGLDLRTTDFHFRWATLAQGQASHAPALTADRTMGALAGIAASRIAKEFHFGGPAHTVCNEDCSGTKALEIAVRALQQGEIDQALAGAVDVTSDPRALLASDAVRPFSKSGTARPFDATGDGCVPGEGAVALVLKRLADAQRDGDRVYAVIRGIGSASGGGIGARRPNDPALDPGQGPGSRSGDSAERRHLEESSKNAALCRVAATPKFLVGDPDASSGGPSQTPGSGTSHSWTEVSFLALHRAYAEAGVDPASVGYLETAATACPDADRPEAQVLDTFFGAAGRTTPCRLGSVQADVGHCGAASGLVAVVKASLALYQEVLPALRGLQQPLPELAGMRQLLAPAAVQYWVRDRAEGPRRAGVSAASVDGNFMHVVLEACENQVNERVSTERRRPLGNSAEKLFLLAAPDRASLLQELEKRREISASNPGRAVELLADAWGRKSAGHAQAPGEWLLLVAQDTAQLHRLLEHARQRVQGDAAGDSGLPRQDRDRIFYTPRDKRLSGGLAFVFPGAGNTFAGMGRELALYWPEILRTQDRENRRLASQMFADRFWNAAPGSEIGTDHRAVICGQVALGTLLSDLALSLGLKPDAALGYSLGEATGLFALRAWRNRDEMLRRVSQSTLFAQDLTGTPDRLRQLWRVAAGQAVQWQAGLVDRSAAEVRAAMAGLERLYLLIVNTPGECVVGGDAAQVRALVAKLGSHWWPLEGVSTVHCELLRPVEAAYRELHRFETTPPAGVQFFSGGWGRAYVPDRETAAAAIVAQAGDCIDFPRVVRAAYDSGIRFFLELGPGNSCSRMIGQILEGRPHVARSLCATAQEPLLGVLRVLGHLAAEGVPLDLSQLRQPPAEAPVKPETARTPQVRIPIVSPLLAATPTAVVAPNAPRASQVLTASAADVELPVPEAQPVAVFVGESVDPFEEQFLAGLAGAQAAALKAHEAYLSFSQGVVETLAQTVQAQLGAIATLAAAQFEVPAQAGVGNGRRALDSGPPRSGVSAERRQIDDCGKSAALCRDATRPQLTSSESARQSPSVALDRAACLEFARGSVAQVLGPEFRRVDSFPTRVRLPDEPLMLVDRILQIEGEARSMTHGRVVTEHDILPGAWYLDGDRIPTCIAVEAGQADLFLSGYLGIDFQTEGRAVYRLLDAKVRFHRGLPGPGAVIHYDIRIDRFFRQGNTWLFRFDFEATVDGQPLLTMTEGCAGFFSAAELAGGRGIVRTAMELQPRPGKRAADWEDWVTVGVESYSSDQLDALRQGDLASCLGPQFAGLTLRQPVTLPTGRMKLVHRITRLDPAGGRFGLGLVRGEADIHPDDWFLTCHFVDDRVMPGTLMFECCLHTLRVLLLRLGWVAEQDTVALEPVPGVASQLKCRGQVLATTARVTYEVVLKEIGYRPEPYVIADALMYADDKPIVEITDMSLRYTGVTRETLRQTWAATNSPADPVQPPLYGPERILAFAIGKPSVAFGAPYAVFDEQRRIARLPGPPYQFLDRITEVQGEPFQMVPGGGAVAQYDIPAGAWYFAANRQDGMPFAVLLEIALQPCGWLAAYAGSALTSDVDLSFRNLGGTGTQRRAVWPTTGTLTTRVKMTRASSSAGMIIQWYDLEVRSAAGLVYKGDTYFGFFPPAALARQEGIREARLYPCSAEEVARAKSLAYPTQPPFAGDPLRMVDHIDAFVSDGGPNQLGFIRATKRVVPEEWFFQAHFYQDPVVPGSLGLESFLQLLKFLARQRWGHTAGLRWEAVALGQPHEWIYRGQIVPKDHLVTVEAVVTAADETTRMLTADGFLSVDGRVIYGLKHFTVRQQPSAP